MASLIPAGQGQAQGGIEGCRNGDENSDGAIKNAATDDQGVEKGPVGPNRQAKSAGDVAPFPAAFLCLESAVIRPEEFGGTGIA